MNQNLEINTIYGGFTKRQALYLSLWVLYTRHLQSWLLVELLYSLGACAISQDYEMPGETAPWNLS